MNENKEKAIHAKIIRALIAKELTPFLNSIRRMDKLSPSYKMLKQNYIEFSNRYSAAMEVMSFIVIKQFAPNLAK